MTYNQTELQVPIFPLSAHNGKVSCDHNWVYAYTIKTMNGGDIDMQTISECSHCGQMSNSSF
jgi:hypothetical protein